MYIPENTIVKIRTGIGLYADGYGFLLKERSSVSLKYGFRILGGVIDESYHGEIIIIGISTYFFQVEKFDRIAQAIPIPTPHLEVVEVDEYPPSLRGTNGFGSSGK